MGKRRAESAEGDPWAFAEARKLGFEPDGPSVCIVGTAWHLVAMAVLLPTPLSTARNRILILGPSHSALFKANVSREDPTELIWGGPSGDMRWRIGPRWLMRGEAPGGHRIYVDARSERRRLRRVLADLQLRPSDRWPQSRRYGTGRRLPHLGTNRIS